MNKTAKTLVGRLTAVTVATAVAVPVIGLTASITPAGATVTVPQTVSSVVTQRTPMTIIPAGTGNASGNGTSANAGSTTGSAGSSGSGGSGGGYHDSWYTGWAQWSESSAVTKNARTSTPNFKGYVAENGSPSYLDQTSPHYNTGTMTLEQAMLKAWRKESFKWDRRDGSGYEPEDIDLPGLAKKCQQGTEYPDAGLWANPLGFQYSVRVQWYDAGGGTAFQPTLREFHFGEKNSDGDWEKTGCQAEPKVEIGDRVCPLYLEAPLGWYSREAYTLPYGKQSALPVYGKNGQVTGWVTSPDEIAGDVTQDPSVKVGWEPGSVTNGKIDKDGYVESNAAIEEAKLYEQFIRKIGASETWRDVIVDIIGWQNMNWVETGKFDAGDIADTYHKKSWMALKDLCGEGKDLSARFQFQESKTGTVDTVLGHRFASTKGWTKKCPTVDVGRAEFDIPGPNLVSPRERHWKGCETPSPLARNQDGNIVSSASGVLNVSIDQYTLTCPGLDGDGFPNVKETGWLPYANGSWRDKNEKPKEILKYNPQFLTTNAEFVQQTYDCQPVKPVAECNVNDPIRRLNPYYIDNNGERKKTDIATPVSDALVDVAFEKPGDVEVTMPAWVEKVLTPEQQQEINPHVISRTLRINDNGALPEFGDGVPNNEPLIVSDKDRPFTNPNESLITEDSVQPGRGVGPDGLNVYSNLWLINGTVPKRTDTLKFHFLDSTGSTVTETVSAEPEGRVEYADVDASKPFVDGSDWVFPKVVVAEGNKNINKFLKQSGMFVGDPAILSSLDEGWVGTLSHPSNGKPIQISRDWWNEVMFDHRPRLVTGWNETTGKPTLEWKMVRIPRSDFTNQPREMGVEKVKGVKVFTYPVWNADVNKDGSKPEKKKKAAADGDPLPFRVQLANDWILRMPIFEWQVEPYQPAKPVVVGWEDTMFYGCGVAEAELTSVKGRGGS